MYCFSRVSQNCKEEGINTFLDEVTASEYFKKACDLKSKQVCYELGLYYDDHEKKVYDPKKANELYKKSCNLDEGAACNALGANIGGNVGVEFNEKKQLSLYEKACTLNNPDGCINLGVLYRNDKNDIKHANELFIKACDLKGSYGCYFYGEALQKEENFKEAAIYHQKSCDLNNESACLDLAKLYQEGKGVTKDEVKAQELFKKSCLLDEFEEACDFVKEENK